MSAIAATAAIAANAANAAIGATAARTAATFDRFPILDDQLLIFFAFLRKKTLQSGKKCSRMKNVDTMAAEQP